MTHITGRNIDRFRLLVLKHGLMMEMLGMKKRRPSCYSVIKEEFNLKGNKQKVYDQFCELIKKEMK
jgi:hypothetical protein